ncbi:MAG: DUF4410 domain-containing protein [Nitrospinales bacterium]
MIRIKLFTCVGALIFLTACGSTSKVLDRMDNPTTLSDLPNRYNVGKVYSSIENVPESFITSISENVMAELKERNIYEENNTAPVNIINVEIINYRMRNEINRFVLGLLAGKDGVKTIVRIFDKDSKKQIGKMYVSSYNLTNLGGENHISSSLAKKIVTTISGEKDESDKNTDATETPQ